MYAMRDPFSDACCEKRLGESVRPLVELTVGDGAVAMTNGHVIRPHRGVLTHDIGDPKLIPGSHAWTCPANEVFRVGRS